MKTHLDCVPCFFKQALSAAQAAGASRRTQKKIVDKVCKILPEFSLELPPPYVGRMIYKTVIQQSKVKDPFYALKQKSNKLALSLYPGLRRKVKNSKEGLLIATELAIAGNIIDFGVKDSLEVKKELKNFLEGNFDIHSKYSKAVFSYNEFRQVLERAKLILYLADNAGEIVFDRILIEEIKTNWPKKKIFCAVRGKPIINDVLIEDAHACGLEGIVPIISSGSDAPGAILKFCSPSFRKLYKECDLVISKGQGNFEALSEEKKTICFLFRAKCSVVAKDMGCKVGDAILKCV